MNVNRIVKWAAAGVLALASVPAVGMAKSLRASLPTDVVTITPTRMDAPLTATPAAHKATHRKTSRNRKVSTRKHASRRHRRVHSAAHKRTGHARKTSRKSATHT